MRNGSSSLPSLLEIKWHGLWFPGFPGCCWPAQVPTGARRQALWRVAALAVLSAWPGWPLPSFWIPNCIPTQRTDGVTNWPCLPGTEFSQDMGSLVLTLWRFGPRMPGPSRRMQRVNIQHPLSELVGVWNGELTRVSVPFFSVRPKTEDASLHCSALYFALNLLLIW